MWSGMLEYGGLALSAIGGAAAVALWLYATGKLSGASDATTALKVESFERRMDEGGRRLSDLTSKLMVLPGTMTQLQEEQARLRNKLDTVSELVADLRVGMARLDERHRLENGRTWTGEVTRHP